MGAASSGSGKGGRAAQSVCPSLSMSPSRHCRSSRHGPRVPAAVPAPAGEREGGRILGEVRSSPAHQSHPVLTPDAAPGAAPGAVWWHQLCAVTASPGLGWDQGARSRPAALNPGAFRAAEQMEILGCVRTGPRTREMAQKYRRGRGRVLKGRTQLGFTALIRLLRTLTWQGNASPGTLHPGASAAPTARDSSSEGSGG